VNTFHAAVDHIDPDTLETTTTYCGTVDQAHVDEVRAIADLPDTERFVKEHPRLEGAFCVLRADGDLDVYVPTDAAEHRVYAPDPDAKGDQQDLPRGASGPAYIDGVTRFGDQSIGGAMDTPGNPPRAVWHTTESPAGGGYFASVAAYLIRVGAEPQVIYDPVTDKLGQFGPLTSSGRALQNDGSRRTNREGKVNIQVEVLGRAASPWTKGFDPAKKPNYRKLIAAMRAHGIPDVWPAGKPAATAAAVASGPRSRTTWQTKGGHFGHCHVPANSHWDPGAIDTSIVPGKAASTPAPSTGGGASSSGTYTVEKGDTLSSIADDHKTTIAALVKLNGLKDPNKLSIGQKLKLPGKTAAPAAQPLEPFPGAGFFHGGRHSPIITAMGRRLVAEGCARYASGPGPNWTNSDRNSYAAWQKKLGYTGSAADGIPGKASWDKLRVPKS
jgi:LysM repeat protein